MKNKRIRINQVPTKSIDFRSDSAIETGNTDLGDIHRAGAICLSPSIVQVIEKMKNWVVKISNKSTSLASSEVDNHQLEGEAIFLNDYAPPVANKIDTEIPMPTGITAEPTQKPDAVKLSWDYRPGRNLYLLQVNVEDPNNPTHWITNSISMYHQVEIDSLDLSGPCWVRICSLRNHGRSQWSTIAIHESINQKYTSQ